ncbi:MAG: redoxin domain-containing protein [Pirellulales bacterium]|nr:redoxin domain-containing protein [Pirellulales bacterium]
MSLRMELAAILFGQWFVLMAVSRSTFMQLAAAIGLLAIASCEPPYDSSVNPIENAFVFGGEPANDAAAEAPSTVDEREKQAGVAKSDRGGTAKRAAVGHPFPRRVPAPALEGGVEWINAAGPIDLKDLRGKFVLLDFWTYCCINCMHVLPVLKQLEHKYPNNLVVIGVHSAKFETEEDSDSIRQAVMRYEIEHPVINDAEHKIWNRYFCESWPSLRMIDPEGNLVAANGGEIQFEVLDDFMKQALPYYRQRKLLDERPVYFDLERQKATQTPLRFPGKILADEQGGRLFIADSNHNRIIVASLSGQLQYTIGSGEIGRADGDFKVAQFNHPQGMALSGDDLYVADTENHLLRKVDLKAHQVKTIAGTGAQAQESWGGIPVAALHRKLPKHFANRPKRTALNSPWALWIHGKNLYIAMAGPHQIWTMPLDESAIGPFAGNGREDIVDGPRLPTQPYELGYSSFAQPSGLSSDGKSLYVADSEGSSIRVVPLDGNGNVLTVIGTSRLGDGRLFTFGDVDGKGDEVKLQHCLDVLYRDGKIYVADTYNHKIKVIDLATNECKTLAGSGKAGHDDAIIGTAASFFEPAGLANAGDKLFVADTNNHLIRVIDLAHQNAVTTLHIADLSVPVPTAVTSELPKKPDFTDAKQVRIEPVALKPDAGENIHLAVKLDLPQGYKINQLAPMRYFVEIEGEAGPIDSNALNRLVKLERPAAQFDVPLQIAKSATPATAAVKLSFHYYYCQEGAEGLCKIGSVSFYIPIKLSAAAKSSTVELPLKVE